MSLTTDMQEIREHNALMVTAGVPLAIRVAELNLKFDEWLFTLASRNGKIMASRINDIFGKAIEV